ncbi:MAG: trigger factor [Alphaproteobacteria bacterium]|nr:trigger factor [Alphaproteobacteria bacterium]
MADVKVLKEDGLNREFSIVVAKQSIDERKELRLAEIGKTTKMQGFRPGKVPPALIKQHYGKEAYADALDKAVSGAIETMLTDRKLRPATQPKIDWVSAEEGKDVEFKVAFEVLPEIKVKEFDSIALERPVAEIEAAKIDEAIVRISKRMREPEAVSEDRAAKMGDVVVIDFDGSVDGEKRPGMKGADHSLELGSKSFIDTFEDQLVGCKTGDKKTISVTFPADYHATELAGKKAEFDVEIKSLRQHKPVEFNDALAKELGLPSIDKLRERIRDDMDTNYKGLSRSVMKRALMDKLADAYTFPVPASLLEVEFDNIWKQVEDAKAKNDLPEEDKKKSDKELREEYRGIAERRIRLGLLLAEVATLDKIAVTNNELRNALMAEARRYPGQEKAVFEYYTKTQGAMERIRAPILEEKVIDHIIGKANITEKKVSVDDLVKLAEEV